MTIIPEGLSRELYTKYQCIKNCFFGDCLRPLKAECWDRICVPMWLSEEKFDLITNFFHLVQVRPMGVHCYQVII